MPAIRSVCFIHFGAEIRLPLAIVFSRVFPTNRLACSQITPSERELHKRAHPQLAVPNAIVSTKDVPIVDLAGRDCSLQLK